MQSFVVGNAAKARKFKTDISNRVFYHNCLAISLNIVSHFKLTALFHPVQLVF